jgi:hypothetical protein
VLERTRCVKYGRFGHTGDAGGRSPRLGQASPDTAARRAATGARGEPTRRSWRPCARRCSPSGARDEESDRDLVLRLSEGRGVGRSPRSSRLAHRVVAPSALSRACPRLVEGRAAGGLDRRPVREEAVTARRRAAGSGCSLRRPHSPAWRGGPAPVTYPWAQPSNPRGSCPRRPPPARRSGR